VAGTRQIEVGHGAAAGGPAFADGAAAAREALLAVRTHRPSLVLVFASVAYDVGEVLRGVRSVTGDAPLVGASTAGEIRDGERRGSVVVAVIASPHLRAHVGAGAAVSRGWSAALDASLAAPGVAPLFDGTPDGWARLTREGSEAFALLFSPGNTRTAPSESCNLLEALRRRSLGRLAVFGGAAADDWRMERNYVFAGERAVEDGVVVAIVETQLRFGIALAHGFVATERRAVVTAAAGSEVLELDGRPAADAYPELVESTRAALEGQHLTLTSGLVVGTPDAFGGLMPNVASYVTPRGGVAFTRPIAVGTALSVMRTDAATAVEAGREAVRKAMLRGAIGRAALAVASCCALRDRLLGGAAREEVAGMVEALGGAPLVGFRSFGEQGLSDDGVPLHTNAVVGALVLGDELSRTAQVTHENARLRLDAEAKASALAATVAELQAAHRQLARTHAELKETQQQRRVHLEALVATRTAQLERANETLRGEIAERERAEAAARRHARALRTLGEINEALVRATEERALLAAACRVLVGDGGYRLAWVGFAERDERRSVRAVAQAGFDDGYVGAAAITWGDDERGSGPVGTAIRTGRPVVARDLAADPQFAPWREEARRRGYVSLAALPLVADGATLGALALYAPDLNAFDAAEMRLLAELADDLAFGITALRGRTERAQMTAQLMQADRLVAMGTLAAGVAHELNNPLAYVLAGLELVTREVGALAAELPPGKLAEVTEVLADVREGGDRIRRVVRDLKTFSRGDEAARGPVDVRRVLESSVNMAFNEIRHRAALVKELAPAPLVEANESRLGQVFLNLLINAAQAIPDGAADRHQIRVATGTDAAGRAVVEIADTGTGIAAESLDRIFEPFYTTKPVGVGTGLGLSICRNLVTAIGGEISVESTPGAGSTFRITLPACCAAEHSACSAGAPPLPARRGRVLVVDDEPAVASATARVLSREHVVLTEHTAHGALQRLAGGERFDVVFCDLMMPQMSGMELYDAVASLDPAQAARVVFLSGGAFTASAREFLERVPNPRMDKPFDSEALRAVARGMVR
jgi:signal transduction histidine kinase/CheY-like chemotaxis protein